MSRVKRKRVMITYEQVDINTVELTRMSISTDYPKFESKRFLYRYEITDCLGFLEEILQSTVLNSKIDSKFFILDLSEEQFSEVQQFLKSDTVFEEVQWRDDNKLLNELINVYKNNPRFWEV